MEAIFHLNRPPKITKDTVANILYHEIRTNFKIKINWKINHTDIITS